MLVCAALIAQVALASSAPGQDPMRPWKPWRTIEIASYRFHFLPEFERWAVDAAQRVESIDSAIVALVGSAPPRPVDVVIHDPFAIPNGYVLPIMDRPVTVWWATPPDPRSAIGEYRSWSEMLAAHELTHVVHLTRPSRNPLQRLLTAVLPARVGPVALKSPRWVIEGYATALEGWITGSGRPNGAWRPAMLRQWAIEGRLPSYTEMSSSAAFYGGEYAYFSGSAFFEWLVRREGDSSLVHLWRRMSARTKRNFDQSFTGVFGEPPAILYGRQTAEITSDAMRAKATLEQAGLREGDLVQRLAWDTGDPAISGDGRLVALTIRERQRPPRLVVWRTGPDSAPRLARRPPRRETSRDTQDVADRAFYPPAKRVTATLLARNGLPFLYPRWFADNRRLLVTRWTPRRDGTRGPSLYIWNTLGSGLRLVPETENVLQADPSPDSREAVAMRCRDGTCDIVRVYFATGGVSVLLQGNAQRSYYRPRFSPDGRRFVASVSDSGRWRVVVADRDGRNAHTVDPDDGANRYDAQWLSGDAGADTLVLVSERGGVPNLEALSISTGATQSVTRVTGAAVAPEVNREDRSLWFLSLHSRGLDVRRLAADTPRADSVVAIAADRFGFAGVQRQAGVPLRTRRVPTPVSYGMGPTHGRWLPGVTATADGASAYLALFRGDLVGRFGAMLSAGYGEPGTWRGAGLRAVWRFPRPSIELGVHAFEHNPTEGRDAVPLADSMDARGLQAVLALAHERRGDGWRVGARAGLIGGPVESRLELPRQRFVAFYDIDAQARQLEGTRGAFERLRIRSTRGTMRVPFWRLLVSGQMGTAGRDIFPLEVGGTLGQIHGSRHPFEEFSLGGTLEPTMDSAAMTQRYPMPALPLGTEVGRTLLAWRIAFPFPITVYGEGVQISSYPIKTDAWHRVIGLERRFASPAIPVAFAPAFQIRGGIGYSLDRPFKDRWRAYVTSRLEP